MTPDVPAWCLVDARQLLISANLDPRDLPAHVAFFAAQIYAAYRRGLEAAAGVCEEYRGLSLNTNPICMGCDPSFAAEVGAETCAAAIRALARG